MIFLYDFLQMRNPKLILLAKNKNFFAKVESTVNSLEHYATCSGITLADVLKKKDLLLNMEQELESIFKDYLLKLVIQKIAYFNWENFF